MMICLCVLQLITAGVWVCCSEFELRYLNDKMIRVSRAFIHTGGVMAQPWYRSVRLTASLYGCGACVCVCMRDRKTDRQRECVCLCVCMRERQTGRECVFVWMVW